MTERAGYSQYYTPPGTAEATGSGYGFQRVGAEIDSLTLTTGDELYVQLEEIGTELGHPFQFDDFGLIGSGDINPLGGSDTLLSGSYMVIDSAHAGRWKIGAEALMHAGDDEGFTLQLWLRVNDDIFIDSIVFQTNYDWADEVSSLSFTVTNTILPQYVDLAEGDVVYLSAAKLSGAFDGSLANAALTAMYIGPSLA